MLKYSITLKLDDDDYDYYYGGDDDDGKQDDDDKCFHTTVATEPSPRCKRVQ
jgi:hypothetical protein